mmetsp:Transcript_4477/g.10807  ORF Transcript_4477/g.10807 Transcript_4477/m.10807 type:complete len:314 (+) Transcript_4477:148-1089(+)
MMEPKMKIAIGVGATAFLLALILIPASLGYVEYYEYGLDQSKITRTVDTETAYGPGRYFIGVSHGFIKYQRDAHIEFLNGLAVFSAGAEDSIGLEFKVDVGFSYLLVEDEIGDLHKELSKNYRSVILSRAQDAIKNEAANSVTFNQYFRERKLVESKFKAAIEKRWQDPPSLHCTMDQFHLGRIQIPDSVAVKQLEAQIQNERNGKETFTQQAEVEREQTAVEVNSINLETERLLRTARAEANLLRSKAKSESDKIRAAAQVNGTQILLEAAGIDTEEDISAYTYIRTLKSRAQLDMDVSYLSPDNVLRTTGV